MKPETHEMVLFKEAPATNEQFEIHHESCIIGVLSTTFANKIGSIRTAHSTVTAGGRPGPLKNQSGTVGYRTQNTIIDPEIGKRSNLHSNSRLSLVFPKG